MLQRMQRNVSRHRTLTATALLLILALAIAVSIPWLQPSNELTAGTQRINDPQRLQANLDALAAGRPVTLIPEVGPPGWYRWVRRDEDHNDSASSSLDQPFSVHGDSFTLIELLPAHPLKRYRLRAQIHHHGGHNNGRAGIYFGYSERVTANGRPVHCYCNIAFNDISVIEGRPRERCNHVRINLELLPQRIGDSPLQPRTQGLGISMDIRPFGVTTPPAWRTLDAVVGPDRIDISWDGVALPTLPRAKLKSFAGFLLNNNPVRPLEDPEFLPQEALGLYVAAASVWFRSFSIEAVPDANQP
jgi:hypothetical protein